MLVHFLEYLTICTKPVYFYILKQIVFTLYGLLSQTICINFYI